MRIMAFTPYVTSYMDVWIEIDALTRAYAREELHPTWMCGLKSHYSYNTF